MQFGSYGGYIGNLSHLLDGLWYSTPKLGQCKPGQILGTTGCSWRATKLTKVANASCVQRRVYAPIETNPTAASCIALCPDGGYKTGSVRLPNRTSACVIKCFQAAVLKIGAGSAGAQALVEPWNKAFASDDPKDGGCPQCHLRPKTGGSTGEKEEYWCPDFE